MNRQAGYIVYAFLLLVIAGTTLRFIQTLHTAEQKAQAEQSASQVTPIDSESALSAAAVKGRSLFQQKCASCHNIFKDITGPALSGFTQRAPWTLRKNLYEWIRNPAAFMAKSDYAKQLKDKFGAMMTAFPDLADEEIDAICDYVEQADGSRTMPLTVQ